MPSSDKVCHPIRLSLLSRLFTHQGKTIGQVGITANIVGKHPTHVVGRQAHPFEDDREVLGARKPITYEPEPTVDQRRFRLRHHAVNLVENQTSLDEIRQYL